MVARLINREIIMTQYPRSELDEMAHRLDREVRHAMLCGCYEALAQAFHITYVGIGSDHVGSDFKFCPALTCKQFVEILKRTE